MTDIIAARKSQALLEKMRGVFGDVVIMAWVTPSVSNPDLAVKYLDRLESDAAKGILPDALILEFANGKRVEIGSSEWLTVRVVDGKFVEIVEM